MQERSGTRHTLVGARILEQDDLALLEIQPRLLRDEQVRAFDDVLEMRLALRIDKRSHVRNVHRLRTATSRQLSRAMHTR
jgi:hypothetical protein